MQSTEAAQGNAAAQSSTAPLDPLLSVGTRGGGRLRRAALSATVLLAGVLVLSRASGGGASSISVEPIGRPIAQKIVDYSEISITEIKLNPTSWEGLQQSTQMLAIDCHIEMTLDVFYTGVRSTLGSSDLRIEYAGVPSFTAIRCAPPPHNVMNNQDLHLANPIPSDEGSRSRPSEPDGRPYRINQNEASSS